jgi:hypothetical protein
MLSTGQAAYRNIPYVPPPFRIMQSKLTVSNIEHSSSPNLGLRSAPKRYSPPVPSPFKTITPPATDSKTKYSLQTSNVTAANVTTAARTPVITKKLFKESESPAILSIPNVSFCIMKADGSMTQPVPLDIVIDQEITFGELKTHIVNMTSDPHSYMSYRLCEDYNNPQFWRPELNAFKYLTNIRPNNQQQRIIYLCQRNEPKINGL